MGILDKLKEVGYEDCLEYYEGEPYFRYDFPSCDSDEAWDTYIAVIETLFTVNLELHQPDLEHDCLTGDLVDVERLKLKTAVEIIEIEKCGRQS